MLSLDSGPLMVGEIQFSSGRGILFETSNFNYITWPKIINNLNVTHQVHVMTKCPSMLQQPSPFPDTHTSGGWGGGERVSARLEIIIIHFSQVNQSFHLQVFRSQPVLNVSYKVSLLSVKLQLYMQLLTVLLLR